MQTDVSNIFVKPEMQILETIKVIDAGRQQLVLVVDDQRRLLGIVADGDIRRGILEGVPLDQATSRIMNASPATIRLGQGRGAALRLMRKIRANRIPVVDDMGRVVGIEVASTDPAPPPNDTLVIIMAGGLGSRLRPVTAATPKPMLTVGGRPLLETTIRRFVEQGFCRFVLCVNHMAHVIVEHFGDGAALGAEIVYVAEQKRMGTAGALGLLKERPMHASIVMNGDVLTLIDFRQLLAFHNCHQYAATMCVCDYCTEVPYGVVQTDGINLSAIVEKPTQRHKVSAGIYVLESDIIKMVPPDTYLDMPQLLESILARGARVSVFPIHEYWLDIGRMDDLKQADSDWLSMSSDHSISNGIAHKKTGGLVTGGR